MVLMNLEETKRDELGQKLFTFFEAIHGENSFEIRFFPQENMLGTPLSVLKSGNYLYTNDSKGEVKLVCEYNAHNLASYLNECLMFAGHTVVSFTPNSPNFAEMESCETKNVHIINGGKINCQFVDIDAPKEFRNDENLLKSWKLTNKKRILDFSLRPSIVVETKNGFHVYWLLNNGNHKLFRYIQMQLIRFFQGDIRCKNESRVLRLPYFLHRKEIDNPYRVTLKIFDPHNKYSQEEIKSALPELEDEKIENVNKENQFLEINKISQGRREDIIDLLASEINENIVKDDENKIMMHCVMPDHPDRNPSAWFDKKYMYYHCSGCGGKYSLVELAEVLGWKHILEAWNRYDIDIESEITRIKEQMINVADLPHLCLNPLDQEQVNNIAKRVTDDLLSHEQYINEKHRQYIYDVIQVLYKANKDKPYLIPLDMGAGKSLIIKVFLQEMIKRNNNFGAIVAVQKIKDVKRIAKEINDFVGSEVAFPMYGFDKEECQLNKIKGNNYSTCIAGKGKRCPVASKCRLFNQVKNQQKYPIIIMTLKGLRLRSEKLTEYSQFQVDGRKMQRDLLIIDEKPEMTYVETLKHEDFKTYSKEILQKLDNKNINDDPIVDEFQSLIDLIEPLFKFEIKGRDIIEPVNTDFNLSDEFWGLFTSIYDYCDSAYEIPKILASIVNNGGFLDAFNEEKINITTSYYNSYRKNKDFKTIIFDGTADIDIEYNHEQYYIFNFEPIRTYEGLTIKKCDSISATKTGMQNEGKIHAFCEEVLKIAEEKPFESIYLPVFKENEDEIREYLKKYIDRDQIKLAHFGSTRGSNNYRDCSIVIIGGILHKTEPYYIGKSHAIYKRRGIILDDIYCSNYENARRFNDNRIELVKVLDMIVDYSQEIKRSKQRDNSQTVKGEVYIFHNDKILLDYIGIKFPKCNIEEWIPEKLIKAKVFSKTNNTNVQVVFKYIEDNSHKEVIPISEIIKETGLKKTQVTEILKKETIQALLISKGYTKTQCEHDKRKRQLEKF